LTEFQTCSYLNDIRRRFLLLRDGIVWKNYVEKLIYFYQCNVKIEIFLVEELEN